MWGIGLEWWILYGLIIAFGAVVYLSVDDVCNYLRVIRNDLQDIKHKLEK